MKIFISYSSQDVALARKIAAQLKQEQFLILRDQEFIEGGQPFNIRIQQVLRGSDVVILLLSKAAALSSWVNEEVIEALNQNKRIIPLMIELGSEPPFGTRTLQRFDFTTDNLWELNYPQLTGLLNRLRNELGQMQLTTITQTVEKPIIFDGNPFIIGPRVTPTLFSGRVEQLKAVIQRVASSELQSVSIVANRRIGKSSFLEYLKYANGKDFPKHCDYARWAFVYLDMQSARARTIEGYMRSVRKALTRNLPADLHILLWPEKQDGSLGAMEESIEELRDTGTAIVMLLDEWEEVQAHPELDTVIDSLRSLINAGKMALITASAYELGRLYEVSKQFMVNTGRRATDTSTLHPLLTTVYLGLMPKTEWETLITNAFNRSHRDIRPSDIRLIGELAGGNPILTQIAGTVVWEGIDKGWGEKAIQEYFEENAQQSFRDWWHKEYVEYQQETLRYVLGLPFVHDPAPTQKQLDDAIRQLKLRGILDESGNVFSRTFINFIHRLHE
jgi:hypothetical protein